MSQRVPLPPPNEKILDKGAGQTRPGSSSSTMVSLSDALPVAAELKDEATSGANNHTKEGQEEKLREHWYQLWRWKEPAPPPPKTYGETSELALASCSLWSYVTYSWCSPIMALGYRRPLQPTDLEHMDPSRSAEVLSANFDAAWERRQRECREYNDRLAAGDVRPPLRKRIQWMALSTDERMSREQAWRNGQGRRKPSLPGAIVEQFRIFYLSSIVFKVFGDSCQLMTPVLAKSIIKFSQRTSVARAAGEPTPPKGEGVGMAVGMYLLTVLWSLLQHQVWWRGMTTGVLMRAALTCSVYKRALILSNKARASFSNGKLMNHLSTDISRIDYCAMWFPSIPAALPQIVLCSGLLIAQIGPSALAGMAFFALIVPIQAWTMQSMIEVRMDSMVYTDQRSKLLQELLGAMRIIKYFVFEKPYSERIDKLRQSELRGIRTLLMIRAMNTAIAFSLPVISAVISFCCYIGIGHELDPARIFTALSLFQLLRQPLMLLPTALSAATDAYGACDRLVLLFEAETMDTTLVTDLDQSSAFELDKVDLEWVALPEDATKESPKQSKEDEVASERMSKTSDPFRITGLTMSVPKGILVAICGPIGSGKSSLLQGLIGEMKRIQGKISFSGTVAYCSQTAWIQNATVRDNILFGREYDEKKYWRVIEEACLLPDCEMLPDGDLTEIGEKGVSISGGQRQRLNIARALYFDADIILFDDPLSALDAHVGKRVFQNAMVDGLRARGKTVVLVTHALHLLPQVDYIYMLDEGAIVEEGTYLELLESGRHFSKLMYQFGGATEKKAEEEEEVEEEAIDEVVLSSVAPGEEARPVFQIRKSTFQSGEKAQGGRLAEGTGKIEGKLIVEEARNTGGIENAVYSRYSKAGYGALMLPMIIGLSCAMQGAQAIGSYWIVWWQSNFWNRSTSFYMALYAALGLLQAIMTLALGFTMAFFSFHASRRLHKQVVDRLFLAPISFFDQTPLGRIMGVLGKDHDTIDNVLPESLRNVVMTISNVLGSIILVTIFEHYFIVVAVFVSLAYRYIQRYYQHSGRELKRIDSLLRGLLYSHFSESLAGMPIIRAYGETKRFVKENEYRMDLENRAYVVYVATQRWLAIRLDAIGALLILAVALFVAVGNSSVSPAQVGLLLTYVVSLVQMFGMLTRQSAEVENNFNGVERITSYSNEGVEQEAAFESQPNSTPPTDWPQAGAIEILDAVMSYRKGLPPVLKGLNISIKGGESIGIIGRTGAGKSSIMSCLFRLVELSSGSISIDGVDIATIGLSDLRRNIVIIPQDSLLLSGTVRTNLDPFNVYEDARLWDALRRAHVVGPEAVGGNSEVERFSLETVIEEDGNNLSAGQRSLISLARALVREEARIVILDEATASVDFSTDAAIQSTIRSSMQGKTLLCIAHRLRTIIHYDRILVMDAGRVAEFATPLELIMNKDSIFHAMCVKSNISEQDIRNAK